MWAAWIVTLVASRQYHSRDSAITQKNVHVWNSSFESFLRPFFGLLSVVDKFHILWGLFLKGGKEEKKTKATQRKVW